LIYTPGLWLFILSSLIIASLIIISWPYRRSDTGQGFLFLMGCAFLWTVAFTLETATPSLQGKLFFVTIEFLGIAFLPAAWLCLILAFTGKSCPPDLKILILFLPILTSLVIWTNPLHHWFIGQPKIIIEGMPFPVLFLDYQFWFYAIHAPTGYLYLLISLIILMQYIMRAAPIYKVQARILLIAILLPSITDVLYVLGFSPVKYYNYTTAVFSLSGILLLWTLFQFRFLDLLPLARDRIIEDLQDCIFVLDHKKRIVYHNQAALRKFKLSSQVIGIPINLIRNEMFQSIHEMLENNQARMDISIGDEAHFDLSIAPVYNRQGFQIGQIITAHDITERVQRFNQVHTLSIQDSLTGVLNRRHFITVCNRELERIKNSKLASAAVVMVDLDAFKQVNDTYGHAAGDKLLVAFADVIQPLLRKYDLFGRLGGDEFAIFLHDVTPSAAVEIIGRVSEAIHDMQTPFNGKLISFTASFGIIHTRQVNLSQLDIEILLNLADQALYQGKGLGKNYIQLYKK